MDSGGAGESIDCSLAGPENRGFLHCRLHSNYSALAKKAKATAIAHLRNSESSVYFFSRKMVERDLPSNFKLVFFPNQTQPFPRILNPDMGGESQGKTRGVGGYGARFKSSGAVRDQRGTGSLGKLHNLERFFR